MGGYARPEGRESGAPLFLFTDLDGTMIYSHRRRLEEPAVWVEELHGRRQSFMTRRSRVFFETSPWLSVIPVTARTTAQYLRLMDSFKALGWRHALVCGGAVLLRDGREDEAWREESLAAVSGDAGDFMRLLAAVRRDMPAGAVTAEEPFLFYVKTDEAERVWARLRVQADPGRLTVVRDARKVYCMPKSMDKGVAAGRYLARFCGGSKTSWAAAGDSELDVPMLLRADLSLYPPSLDHAMGAAGGEKIVCAGVLADAICHELERRRNEVEDFDQ